ncbi:MAG: hypothetical protein GFH27_549279n507 [Chloroflexi bacterium AL-W]|nr:hypothetical protein [Chloroflexi bacterium AL-N1]NOK65472.1 hypothetical protein [Chloroflexi bacterium AL-N10]NOK72262.1 hypothetical protein [Chloroflexi bacterium AL-N5]NOK79652.1 hypothetical protein [Chloroflexi bacterium AL-W]NOK87567.1 hypothetical protein [Chloroflexi bacterium AL-N15]
MVEDPISNTDFVNVTEGTTPTGFTFATIPSPSNTIVRYNGGSIPVGENRTFTFNVTLAPDVTIDDVIPNIATVTRATTLPGPDINERDEPEVDASDDLTIIAPDLVVTKDDGEITVTAGQILTYTITVENVGTGAATGVVITDTIPTDTTFNSASNSGNETTVGSGVVIWPSFTLAASDTVTRTVTVHVNHAIPAGTTSIINNVVAFDDGTNGDDPTSDNNSDDDIDLLNAEPDLTLTKTDNGVTATAGEVLTYTLTYENVGTQNATGVVLTDTIPTHTSFNPTASSAAWTCTPDNAAGSICAYPLGDLAVGATGTLTFVVTVDLSLPAGVTTLSNTATITDDGSNGDDPTPNNNSDDETTPIEAVPDLTITKVAPSLTIRPGDVLTYTLTFTNTGSQDATGVVITDTVPEYSTFEPTLNSTGWACTPNTTPGSICSYTVGSLSAGNSDSITFVTTIDNPLPTGVDMVTNTAVITDDGSNGDDPNPDDNTGIFPPPIDAAPDLRLVKDDDGITTTTGGVITYTLTYENAGDQDATNIVITDTVPAHTTFDPVASPPAGTVHLTQMLVAYAALRLAISQ